MVSKAGLMNDLHTLQQQFEAFLKIYEEDKLANERRLCDISTQLEELFSTTRTDASIARDDERSRSHGDGYSHVPRYSIIDFPLDDNDQSDPLDWLTRCEHFFRLQRTPEEDKVGLAALHLVSKYKYNWFIKLERDKPNLTWEDFKCQFDLRFGPLERNKFGELCKLSQDGTVDDYIRRFEALAVRAGPLSKEQEVEIFISGLQESIAANLGVHRPKDLISAMTLALLYERTA